MNKHETVYRVLYEVKKRMSYVQTTTVRPSNVYGIRF